MPTGSIPDESTARQPRIDLCTLGDMDRFRPSGRFRVVGRRLIVVLAAGLFLLALEAGSPPGTPGVLPALPGGVAAAEGSPPPASASPAVEPTPTPTPTALPAAALQARLEGIRTKYRVPGVSVTIIWPDGRTWTGVSGWANLARHVPVVPGTAFSIGSVTKTFMAALVLELAQDGRLSLDDRVRRWLPTARVASAVTIRELLEHSSGVFDFFSSPTIDVAILADRRRVWTPSQALSYMRSPYCAAGQCWHYSNSNYVILGQIVKRVTGYSATSELRARLFDPLGLRRTFVQGSEARRGAVATSYKMTGSGTSTRRTSLSDGTTISPFTSVVTAAGTAGAIAASSRDLAAWARALYGGTVLDQVSEAAMLDVTHSLSLGSGLPYGLGVMEQWFGGRWTYGHNGRLIGARASIRYLPDYGFAIAVVTNQDRIGPDVFGTALMNIAIPPPPPPLPPSSTPAPGASPISTP
jgi:D-alanyl-D-alanine carboxypeptidase